MKGPEGCGGAVTVGQKNLKSPGQKKTPEIK